MCDEYDDKTNDRVLYPKIVKKIMDLQDQVLDYYREQIKSISSVDKDRYEAMIDVLKAMIN